MRALSYACHFRSRDKDGGHAIQFAVFKNSMRHANVMLLCFIEPESLPIEVLHCQNRDFLRFFCSCHPDLDPMTFIYELSQSHPWRYRPTGCANMNFLSQSFRKLSPDRHRQTDKQTGTTKII